MFELVLTVPGRIHVNAGGGGGGVHSDIPPAHKSSFALSDNFSKNI